MRNLCDTCAKTQHCLINRLRLKFHDDLRIIQAEASMNGLDVITRLAVDECNLCQETESQEEAGGEGGEV